MCVLVMVNWDVILNPEIPPSLDEKYSIENNEKLKKEYTYVIKNSIYFVLLFCFTLYFLSFWFLDLV